MNYTISYIITKTLTTYFHNLEEKQINLSLWEGIFSTESR